MLCDNFDQKWVGPIFWAIVTQTHLVTLAMIPVKHVVSRRLENSTKSMPKVMLCQLLFCALRPTADHDLA
jgi:hypothetical protein